MLSLRLTRGTHPLVLLRRLLVAAASAGVGFLLLCTLGWALGHPAGSYLRLLWCLVPLAATVQFAVAVARTDPSTRPRRGLSAVGLGPARLTMLAVVSTAVATTLGSAVALLVFLHLRGDLTGMPFDGDAADLLSADRPLPMGAALTLLAAAPVLATLAAGFALRPRPTAPVAERSEAGTGAGAGTGTAEAGEAKPRRPDAFAPSSAPSGLPWGVALTAAGLAVETYASRNGNAGALPLPGRFDSGSAGVLAGWALTAVGLALAGPGITHLCGWLLQTLRPGAVRLLAGRTLMSEARRIGRPLGVLCAVISGAFAAASLYGPGDERPFGPLTGLGAGLVIGCTAASLLTAALESRQARATTTEELVRLGAPAAMLRTAAAVRAATLVAVFVPLTWAVASLAAVPLTA
ncbi:hypothetical protein [Streptomyces liangshanensis]|uniref:Uncharacterized protein n=1 Tax=Streptomyces liangshanensis TaxID=2717324 RepID=A0A6G9GWP1_9ACTN|nr:hypothetical protein [Streptomyces liangshanensis]QIQ02421.1 hypothetical protein HA039_08935 [Streptomyces liangshanensis]